VSFSEQMRNNDAYFGRSPARTLQDLGACSAVKRLLSRYGSVKIKTVYISMLRTYFRWPKEAKGARLGDKKV
jgi:hypothetical protein